MLTIKIKSGLGNQMFQYAFGRSAALKKNLELAPDISSYDQQSPKDTPRNFLLNRFSITGRVVKIQQRPLSRLLHRIKEKIKNTLNPHRAFIFYPKELCVSDGDYLEGYWQSEKYLSDISDLIRKEFRFMELDPATIAYEKEIQNKKTTCNTISIHVRRGDYITNVNAAAYHTALGIEYIHKALEQLETYLSVKNKGATSIHIYAFSDDIPWLKKNLNTKHDVTFVDHPHITNIKDEEYIHLMSMCDHHVIANSSFSWWGAWLNPSPNKIVIAPKQWVRDPKANTQDVVPNTWIRI